MQSFYWSEIQAFFSRGKWVLAWMKNALLENVLCLVSYELFLGHFLRVKAGNNTPIASAFQHLIDLAFLPSFLVIPRGHRNRGDV